jgi:alkylated DNA repair protein alkB family protein 8
MEGLYNNVDIEKADIEKTDIEKTNVVEAYSQIAPMFSDTRPKPWDWINDFYLKVAKYKPNALVLDHGCGGGRNMQNVVDTNAERNLTKFAFIGIDNCPEFIKIARVSGYNAIQSDMCELPFNNDVFDAVISVASFHHLATVERRIKALSELYRVMKSGSMGCMSVWSINQPIKSKNYGKFKYGNNLVPWSDKKKNIICERYYYIFELQELYELFEKCNFIITDHEWEYGNEIIYFTKN